MTSVIEKESTLTSQGDDVVLSVNGVSKKFCRDLKRSLLYGMQDISAEVLGLRQNVDTLRAKEFWALKDVSFQLRKGEALGLVGKNGSGKSTLLRIIAGLIRPDAGSIEVNGRVAPLIALGAGFNPILTGRENVYANMSILGLTKQEIDDRFDEVIDFAEIGEAIDSPVQSYSSGMAARLGFASAIYTAPDILLIDEVLAVGDSRFRGKCFRKLHELRRKNTSFILVSHDSHTILTVCDSAVYLNLGISKAIGNTPEVMQKYEEDLFINDFNAKNGQTYLEQPKSEDSEFSITNIFFRNAKGKKIDSPTSGEDTYLCISCKVDQDIDNVGCSLIFNELATGGESILSMNSYNDRKLLTFTRGEHELQIKLSHLGLRLGVYSLNIYFKRDTLYHLNMFEAFQFQVLSKEVASKSLFYQPREWLLVPNNPSTRFQ
jgi:lipopolysaccharide transport system ATP-binding protein